MLLVVSVKHARDVNIQVNVFVSTGPIKAITHFRAFFFYSQLINHSAVWLGKRAASNLQYTPTTYHADLDLNLSIISTETLNP
jgi:hypothetical protein